MNKAEVIKLFISNAVTNILFLGLISGVIGFIFNRKLSKHNSQLEHRLEEWKTEKNVIIKVWDDNRIKLFEFSKNLYSIFKDLNEYADNLSFLLDYYCLDFEFDQEEVDSAEERFEIIEKYMKQNDNMIFKVRKKFEDIYYMYNLLLNENMMEHFTDIINKLDELINDKEFILLINLNKDYLDKINKDNNRNAYEYVIEAYKKHDKLINIINKRDELWNEFRESANIEKFIKSLTKPYKEKPKE